MVFSGGAISAKHRSSHSWDVPVRLSERIADLVALVRTSYGAFMRCITGFYILQFIYSYYQTLLDLWFVNSVAQPVSDCYNAEHHRLRCNGHRINLAARSFLFHTDDEALTDENNASGFTTPTDLEKELWRRSGLLGNSTISWSISSGAHNSWLILENSMAGTARWNSWYAIIVFNETVALKADGVDHWWYSSTSVNWRF